MRCPICPVLQGKIFMLQAEIAQLKFEIYVLKRRIARSQATAESIISQSQEAMKGHLPRGNWAYYRGASEAAGAALKALKGWIL